MRNPTKRLQRDTHSKTRSNKARENQTHRPNTPPNLHNNRSGIGGINGMKRVHRIGGRAVPGSITDTHGMGDGQN